MLGHCLKNPFIILVVHMQSSQQTGSVVLVIEGQDIVFPEFLELEVHDQGQLEGVLKVQFFLEVLATLLEDDVDAVKLVL